MFVLTIAIGQIKEEKENVRLSTFETKVEIIRHAKCHLSVASGGPLTGLRLVIICSNLKKNESILKM